MFPVACAVVINGVAIASTAVIKIMRRIKGITYSGICPNHNLITKGASTISGSEINMIKKKENFELRKTSFVIFSISSCA